MKQGVFFVTLLLTVCCCKSQVMWQFKKDTVITWYYSGGDEFNADRVNTNYWKYSGAVRSILSNKEQQYYTDGENHLVKNGELVLEAKKLSLEKRVVDWKADNDSVFDKNKFNGINKRHFNYTSGYLESLEPFLYGYFEIKFKMPSKKGFWPAFWLYGGSPGEEIDMMELKTEKKNKIHVGRHSPKREENYLKYRLRKRVWGDWIKFNGDLTSDFNVVSGEWTKEFIRFYVNGECVAHTKVSLNQAKKLILNIAVPSNGPFKPGPADSVLFSGGFEVDYIRIWSERYLNNDQEAITLDNTVHPERKIGVTKLKSKDKFIYGAKRFHENEGITISFFRTSKDRFQLTVLGKQIPENAFYTIKNEKGTVIFSGPLVYGESSLNLLTTPASQYTLESEVYGMKKSYSFKN